MTLNALSIRQHRSVGNKEGIIMPSAMSEIREELKKYGLVVTGSNWYKVGQASIYHVSAKGKLWESEYLKSIWPEQTGAYPEMADAMHRDLYNLAPESTQIVVVGSGDNIKGVSYFIFVIGEG